mgnify:CR=1 FL=1
MRDSNFVIHDNKYYYKYVTSNRIKKIVYCEMNKKYDTLLYIYNNCLYMIKISKKLTNIEIIDVNTKIKIEIVY